MILDGKALSKLIRESIKSEVAELKAKGISVGLGAIIVGDDPASRVYVGMKERACNAAGIYSEVHRLEASAKDLAETIERLNTSNKIDGILLQLPLPRGIQSEPYLRKILPEKDADGLHPFNLGNLLSGVETVSPCTPAGVIKILEHHKIDINRKHAVIIGRSVLVGRTVAQMLLNRNATVEICHSHTQNLGDEIRRADIVIAAAGKAGLVQGDWIKKGATVIDVGINRLPSGEIVGDVEFEAAKKRAGAITPVPGGVGPMTVTMLLQNTVNLAKQRANL